MNFTLNDRPINFTLTDDRNFRLNDPVVRFDLLVPREISGFRLLEMVGKRLLEDGGRRKLE